MPHYSLIHSFHSSTPQSPPSYVHSTTHSHLPSVPCLPYRSPSHLPLLLTSFPMPVIVLRTSLPHRIIVTSWSRARLPATLRPHHLALGRIHSNHTNANSSMTSSSLPSRFFASSSHCRANQPPKSSSSSSSNGLQENSPDVTRLIRKRQPRQTSPSSADTSLRKDTPGPIIPAAASTLSSSASTSASDDDGKIRESKEAVSHTTKGTSSYRICLFCRFVWSAQFPSLI